MITSVEYFGWTQRAAETVALPADESLIGAQDIESNPGKPFQVEITASKDRWLVRYSDNPGRTASSIAASTARDIHVPLERDVIIVLKSDEFIYTFGLPEFGLKEIAVPNLEFRMQLHPTEIGRFLFVGEELCGDPHSELQGQLVVQSPQDLSRWLRRSVAARQ